MPEHSQRKPSKEPTGVPPLPGQTGSGRGRTHARLRVLKGRLAALLRPLSDNPFMRRLRALGRRLAAAAF